MGRFGTHDEPLDLSSQKVSLFLRTYSVIPPVNIDSQNRETLPSCYIAQLLEAQKISRPRRREALVTAFQNIPRPKKVSFFLTSIFEQKTFLKIRSLPVSPPYEKERCPFENGRKKENREEQLENEVFLYFPAYRMRKKRKLQCHLLW